MINLTELTARQIAAEEQMTRAGHVATARLARLDWNHSYTASLVQSIEDMERAAVYVSEHPVPFVIWGKEPYQLDPQDARALEMFHLLPIFSRSALEGCRHSAEIAAEERRRRGVD